MPLPGPSGLPNPYDTTAGHPGQYPNSDQSLLYPPVNPMSTQRVAQMARLHLRDLPRPFVARQVCSGVAWRFELPIENVDRNTIQVVLTDTTAGGTVAAILDQDYVLDDHGGIITFQQAPGQNLLMVAQGTFYRDYLPPELDLYVRTAYLQHTYGEDPTSSIDNGYPPMQPPALNAAGQPVSCGGGVIIGSDGSIQSGLGPAPSMISEAEEYPLSLLVTILALWDMAIGAAQQHDVHTPDGVTIPISQVFSQIMTLIDRLQQQYLTLSTAMGVGLYRITQSRLRRVSRTTKRLVPIWRSQEYDKLTWPQREIPPIDVTQQMYTYQGLWDSTRPYNTNDLVDYENQRYVCLQPNTDIDPTRDVCSSGPAAGTGYYWQWSTINTGWVGWW
jgi:hypothetical protein